jgi:hypothetical protein
LGEERKAGSRLLRADNTVCVGAKNVLNALVLKKRSEAFRLNKFFSILQRVIRRINGVKMKPRGGERDSPIGDVLCFIYMPYAIATNFLPQEINLGSCGNNLSEPFAHTMIACPICSVSHTVLPCLSEENHPWDFVSDHIQSTYPRPSVCAPGCE